MVVVTVQGAQLYDRFLSSVYVMSRDLGTRSRSPASAAVPKFERGGRVKRVDTVRARGMAATTPQTPVVFTAGNSSSLQARHDK